MVKSSSLHNVQLAVTGVCTADLWIILPNDLQVLQLLIYPRNHWFTIAIFENMKNGNLSTWTLFELQKKTTLISICKLEPCLRSLWQVSWNERLIYITEKSIKCISVKDKTVDSANIVKTSQMFDPFMAKSIR